MSPVWLLFPAGITFSRDGRYLALAERRDCKDYVSIFVCSDWQLLRVRPPLGRVLGLLCACCGQTRLRTRRGRGAACNST